MENALYARHLETLLHRYRVALEEFKLDAIVVASGSLSYYFQDDNSHPFKAFSFAQQWLPFQLPANCFIVFKRDKPELIWPGKQDFWHMANAIPEGEWQHHWQITPVNDDTWQRSLPKRSAFIGPVVSERFQHHEELFTWLTYDRAVKTSYEISCLERASQIAVLGHNAAEQAFKQGACELDVHLAYLAATKQDASDTPYPNIVGINEHAAVLHYEKKSVERCIRPLTLLVDAGASYTGYASDITRTTTVLDDDFSALVKDMDTLQQQLVGQSLAGNSFVELHYQTLAGVAKLLKKHDICKLSVEEQLAKHIPQYFFPHGLGHLLGLQVHDLGGKQHSRKGETVASPKDSPYLRLTRPLLENMVITIEPGLYFIPMLLDKMRAEQPQHGCSLSKIEALLPYGGIRIEDNVVVGVETPRNLTREAFAQSN
ncbi:Xaa-Pro dipeptidase [Marinomonas ostreistagni]|uniref:Xaa-Pro dipeptidase n=1 Tax=Marinomonas ostreistagni TaxID=359209 RepID=A0ABS0Z8C5_9GAMM|nr:Xaa-Pro dipeptidase [Marinomonas ostreistagni]MBJ7549912.1 Xaa-Pro dipeptidase [Marinomonas ostreistagni]